VEEKIDADDSRGNARLAEDISYGSGEEWLGGLRIPAKLPGILGSRASRLTESVDQEAETRRSSAGLRLAQTSVTRKILLAVRLAPGTGWR